MIFLFIIFLLLAIYFIFFVAQFYNIVFRGYAPFVSTDRETLKKVISEIRIEKKSVIYELGCGRAKFLRMVEKKFPEPELVGIENLFSLYFINKILLKLKRSRIKLLKKNFFVVDLKNADLIYCYLNNETMTRLEEKFSRECKAGTQIISRSFPIPQFTPEKAIEIKNKKIYFYKIFRS